ELGLPALNFGAWWAMWGPPGMPADLVRTMNGWVNDAVKELAAEGRLATLGIEPASETPQTFAKFIADDLDRSARLLKAANFLPEGAMSLPYRSSHAPLLAPLLDHLVSDGKQRRWNLDAYRASRRKVDDEFKPGRPPHRQV